MSFAGTSTPNKTGMKPKYSVSMVRGRNGAMTIRLSEEQLEEFKRLYPITTNKRRYRQVCKKRSIKRKELIESERRRLRLGLEMNTNLVTTVCPLRKYTRKETMRRHYAFKNGYILGDIQQERYTLFFDDNTHRCNRFEKNAVNDGWSILEFTE